jgi:isoleucyl-tRNA synthetase
MNLIKNDKEIINLWDNKGLLPLAIKANPVRFSSDQKKINFQANITQPINISQEIGLNKLSELFILDSINRLNWKLNIPSINLWGFNFFDHGVENSSKDLAKDMESDTDVLIQERSNYACNLYSTQKERKWYKLLKETGFSIPLVTSYRNSDTELTLEVWKKIYTLWNKNLFVNRYSLCFYSPELAISISPELAATEIVYEKQKTLTPIVRFQLAEDSIKKMREQVLTEIDNQSSLQQNLKNRILQRLWEIKHMGGSNKKPRFDFFRKEKFKEEEEEWSSFQATGDLIEETEELKEQLETVNQNLQTFEIIATKFRKDYSISLLSWVANTFTLPAITALAVNPETEYSLFYLENNQEIILVAEKRAVATIALQLDPNIINSPELQEVLNSSHDSSEYFEKIGEKIYKLATFYGKDLEGLEYEPLFSIQNQNQSWEEKSNCNKVYTSFQVSDSSGTGIYAVAPAYGITDFQIKLDRNLPLVFVLDEKGIFSDNVSNELKLVEKLRYEEAGDILIGLLDKKNLVFATLISSIEKPFYNTAGDKDSKNDFYDFGSTVEQKFHLYPLAVKNWNLDEQLIISAIRNSEWTRFVLNLNNDETAIIQYQKIDDNEYNISLDKPPKIVATSKKLWGLPVPLWRDENNNTICIPRLKELIEYSVNPIYLLINSKNLDPIRYSEESIALFTDKQTKLPLGLNTVQYRSNSLTELRKEKDIDLAIFSRFAPQILEEIFNLFEKYKTVQILLEEDERKLFSSWLYGNNIENEIYEKNIYFYKQVRQETREGYSKLNISWKDPIHGDKIFVPSSDIKLLKLQRPYIDDIILSDKVGNIYYRSSDVLDPYFASGLILNSQLEEFLGNSQMSLTTITESIELQSWLWLAIIFCRNSTFDNTNFLTVQERPISNIENNSKVEDDDPFYEENKVATMLPTISVEEILTKNDGDFVRQIAFLNLEKRNHLNYKATNRSNLASTIERSEILDKLNLERMIFVLEKNSQEYFIRTMQTLNEWHSGLQKVNLTNFQFDPKLKFVQQINNWWYTFTLKTVRELDETLTDHRFDLAIKIYQNYLYELCHWYFKWMQQLNLSSINHESYHCLKSSIILFLTYSSIIQPINSEKINFYLQNQEDYISVLEYPWQNLPKLSENSERLLEKIEKYKKLQYAIDRIRQKAKIPYKQLLYADFSDLNLEDDLMFIMAKKCNLISRDLSRVEGGIELIESSFGYLKLDMVIYNELVVLSFGKEIEQSVLDFRKKLELPKNKNLVMEWRLFDSDNEELIQKVLKCLNWENLNVDIRWANDLSPQAKDIHTIVVKELTNILVRVISVE